MEYNTLFPGIVRELFCAVWLMLGAYGSGKLLFIKAEKMPSQLAALACGMVVNAAAGVVAAPELMAVVITLTACFGVYKLFFEIKKAPWLFVTVGILMLPFVANALLPPWSWDEQVYQISLLKYYVSAGSFPVRMDNPYSAYPSLVHAFLLPGISLGGVSVARLSVLLVLGVCGGRFYRLFSKDKWLTIAVLGALMLSQLTLILLRDFYVEPFILLFAFAGLEALWQEKCSRSVAAVAAIAAAGCASVKLTGIGMSLCIVISLLWRKESREYWKIFIGAAVLAASPFFIRVLWFTGNPFYPYFSVLSGNASQVGVEKFHRVLGGHYGIDPLYGSALGWLFAAWQKKLYDGIITGWQFPLLFLTALAGSYRVFRSDMQGYGKKFAGGAVVLLAGYLFWSLTARQTRFLFPVMFMAAALAVAVIMTTANRRWRNIFIFFTVSTMLWSVCSDGSQLLHHYYAWRALPGARRYPLDFAMRHDRGMVPLVRAINALPAGSRIAMLMERRTLYLKPDVTLLMPYFQEKLTPLPENSDSLFKELAAFDYLVIRLPQNDVDSAEEYVGEFSRLYAMLKELIDVGKLQYVPGVEQAILRVVP